MLALFLVFGFLAVLAILFPSLALAAVTVDTTAIIADIGTVGAASIAIALAVIGITKVVAMIRRV